MLFFMDVPTRSRTVAAAEIVQWQEKS